MRNRGQSWWVLVVTVVVSLTLIPVIPYPAHAQQKDTVIIGMAQEPDCLIAGFCSMAAGRAVLNSLQSDMAGVNEQWKAFPVLIEKIPNLKDGDWTVSGKKMKITYKLKKGYTWHDGKPVTAIDVSWTYLMMRNPRTPTVSRFILRKIDNMLVPDPNNPYTLVVQWKETYPFANEGHTILPKHVLEADYLKDPSRMKTHKQNSAPILNGPYKFVEWVKGSHITLEAYDKYPGQKAKIRRQVWRFILDSTVLQANQMAGQVDATEINNFSIDQMAEIEKRAPTVAPHYTPSLVWEHIDLNLDNAWLKDKRVRQAIIHAINREEMSAKLFQGKQPVAHTWLPERHEGTNPSVKKYAYDPARARALLAEAGFKPGSDGVLVDASGKRFELTIMTTAGNSAREQVESIMKEQLKAVGIDLKIDNRPASVLFGQVTNKRQFPHLVMYAWVMGRTSIGTSLWHSSQIPSQANSWEGQNYPGWRNAESDKLIDQIASELDSAKRNQMLRRQQEIWVDELPSIPLFFKLSLTTAKKSLKNVKPVGLSGTYITWNSNEWVWQE